MNEDNLPQPNTNPQTQPTTDTPDMVHPSGPSAEQASTQTPSNPMPQPELTPMPTEAASIPQPESESTPQPAEVPLQEIQEPKTNQQSSNQTESDYGSNPFIAVGRGLGAALSKNPVASIMLAIIPYLVIIPLFFLAGLVGGLSGNNIVALLLGLVAFVVFVLVILRASAGSIIVLLESSNGNNVTTKEAMGEKSTKRLTSYFVSIMLTSIFVFIGLILFIIPGIFLIARLSLAPVLVFSEDLKAMAAIKRSFKLTKGHAFEMLSVLIAQSVIASNGLLATISSYSGLTRRYIEIEAIEKSGASKPKTHWLNFVLPILALLVIVPYIALAIMGASSSNNLGNSGFGNSDDDYGFSSFSTASDSAADTTRKNDINSLYQKLEEYYNENGSYPNEPISSFNASELFPGIDSDALIDENGNDILVNFDDSIYIINYPYPDSTNQYVLTLYGEGCDGFSGDTSCQSYTLAGYQATGFIDYVKSSLN